MFTMLPIAEHTVTPSKLEEIHVTYPEENAETDAEGVILIRLIQNIIRTAGETNLLRHSTTWTPEPTCTGSCDGNKHTFGSQQSGSDREIRISS